MPLLTNVRVVTCGPAGTIENGYVELNGSRITAVGQMAELDASAAATGESLQGHTVIPGLINSHIHFTMRRGIGAIESHPAVATEALRAMRCAINCLREGVTTARDMGHNDHVHRELRDAIRQGVVIGPRVVAAGDALVMSYGHAHFLCVQVHSREEIVREIRRQVHEGADFIKIIASNDDLMHYNGEELARPWFSLDDLKAAAEAAHDAGVPITAHANGRETIRRCIEAGFDCLEHGIYLTEELAHQMKERGIWLVPTLTGYKQNADPSWGRKWVARYQKLWAPHLDSARHAVAAGVKIAAGTDTLGLMSEEVELLVAAGMAPQQALEAATIQGARLLGLEQETGSLEPGKAADLAVVEGDPLAEAQALSTVRRIYVGGQRFDKSDLDRLVPPSPAWAQGW